MSKVKVKTGLQSRTNLKFQNYHTTTSDFFQLDVAYMREIVPEQSLTLNLVTQARLAGMPVPTYADVSLHRRAFFVPMRTIFKGWNSFIEQTPYFTAAAGSTSGIIQSHVPQCSLTDFIQLFQSPIMSYSAGTSETFDFRITYIDGTSTHAENKYFTDRGRQAYKVLTQLGYSFQFDNPTQSLGDLNSVKYSLLPLLAFLKVYSDWFVPTAYRTSSDFVNLENILTLIRDSSNFDLSSLTDPSLQNLLRDLLQYALFVSYDHDYFTDAFDKPVGNNLLNPSISVDDNSSGFSPAYHSKVEVADNGTPFIKRSDDSSFNVTSLTSYALDWLQKLTGWMKRRQIAGSRVLENYLAEFGVKLPATNLDMSVYLDGDSVPVVIKDITATSQTLNSDQSLGSNLGDYAGQGRVFADNPLKVTCDANGEYGIFLVLTSLVPKIGYVQGVRRHCLHLKPLDFYHGDFDGLGNREIRLDELALPELSDNQLFSDNPTPWNEVFGFTRQYSEYKVSHDTLSGDFRVGRLNKAGFTSSAWHLNRMFLSDDNGNFSIPKHSLSFLLPYTDKSQYNRMFYVLEAPGLKTNADHFVLNHIQMVETSVPFKPLYADYDLDHIDGNSDVTLDANGNYMT